MSSYKKEAYKYSEKIKAYLRRGGEGTAGIYEVFESVSGLGRAVSAGQPASIRVA
jgi:hypothetical protein